MSSGYQTVKAGYILKTIKNIPWWMLGSSIIDLANHSRRLLKERVMNIAMCLMFTTLAVVVVADGAKGFDWFWVIIWALMASMLQLLTGFVTKHPLIRITDEEKSKLDLFIRLRRLQYVPKLSTGSQQDEVMKFCLGSLRVLAGEILDLEERLSQKRALPRSEFGLLAQIELLENDLDEARERFYDHHDVLRGFGLVSLSKEKFFLTVSKIPSKV